MQENFPELTVEEAEAAIRLAARTTPDPVIIVDFDETLWLRNSTEEYLRSLRPRWLAFVILLLLDMARPWKWTFHARGEHVFRDWIRVLVCTTTMPWSLPRWRRDAARNAELWKNAPLLSLLAEVGCSKPLVATLGTDVIVEPLLSYIHPNATLCAAGTLRSGYRIRDLGKRAWIERHVRNVSLANALVITDSESDADLLDSCGTPILVKWPGAEYRPAMAESYIPFLYTQRAKRPGENYMLYGVLLEDVVLLCLAFAWLMPSPLLGALGLILLHLSFWAVYEIGYVENDTFAIKHEAKPKTFEVASAFAARVTPWKAWLAAGLLGAAGTAVLALSNGQSLKGSRFASDATELALLSFVIWMAYLLASRLAFWLYNHLDVQSRGHFYVVLQVFRSVGYAILIHINWTGAIILLPLVLARWFKYLVYRSAGKTFDEDQRLLTLVIFVVLACGGLAVQGAAFLSPQALVALAWFSAYSHRRLRALFQQARLARGSPSPGL